MTNTWLPSTTVWTHTSSPLAAPAPRPPAEGDLNRLEGRPEVPKPKGQMVPPPIAVSGTGRVSLLYGTTSRVLLYCVGMGRVSWYEVEVSMLHVLLTRGTVGGFWSCCVLCECGVDPIP